MTANIYPYPSDLPPGSQQFARETIKRVTNLEQTLGSGATDQNATNKGLAASLGALTEQVNDLAFVYGDLVGRASYQASNGNTGTWSTTTAGPIAIGPTITFTVDRARVVSLTFGSTLTATAQMNVAGTATTTIGTTVLLNGSQVSDAYGNRGYVVAQAVNAGANAYNVGTAPARYLVTVPAGTHTVRGAVTQVNRTNGTGTAGLDLPSVFVDILQPAA